MPLNKKGKTMLTAMAAEYGAKKGKEVFYAMENSGKARGVKKAVAKKKTVKKKQKK